MKAENLYEALAHVSPDFLQESEAPVQRRPHRILPRCAAIAAVVALIGCVTALAVTLTLRDAAREDMGISADQSIPEWSEYETQKVEGADTAAGTAGSVQLTSTLCSGSQLIAYLEVAPVSEEIAASLEQGGDYTWEIGALDRSDCSIIIDHVAYDAATQTALVKLQLSDMSLQDAGSVSFALALYNKLEPEVVYEAVEIPVTRSDALSSLASIQLPNDGASGMLWSISVYAGYVELSISVTPLADLTDDWDDPDTIEAYFGSWHEVVEAAMEGATINYTDGTSEAISEMRSPLAGSWVCAVSVDDVMNGSLVMQHIVSNAIDLSTVESVTIGSVTYPFAAK